MKRLLKLALAILPALALAQTAPTVGVTTVTVSWAAPSAYEPVEGVVTALAVTTAPAGTLTNGTYPLFLTQSSNDQSLGLQATLTIAGGEITTVSVTEGGSGYSVGDTLTLPVGALPGATSAGALQVTAVTNSPAVAMAATDIDHYTVWWGDAAGNPGQCASSICSHAPWGIAEVPAGATNYMIPAACGDLEIGVSDSTTATAYIPDAMSLTAYVTYDTGLQCPVIGAPGTPKLAWPKA